MMFPMKKDFTLVLQIEDELGSTAALLEKFSGNSWKISELVTLVHILLHGAGQEADYLALGNRMLKEGLDHYLTSALSFLRLLHWPHNKKV